MAPLTEISIIVLFLMIVPSYSLKVSASNNIKQQNLPQRRYERSIKVSEEFKKAAVDSHNKARFNVNPPATNMQNMVWNDDLAVTAQNYGNKCVWGHNDKRTEDTKNKIWTPKDVGENLYYTTAKLTDIEVMELAVKKWDAEKKDYTYETAKCAENKVCGHYTQVVWQKSMYVGCGIAYCSERKKMITCNYGPAGNYKGEKPYIASSTGGTGGTDSTGRTDENGGAGNTDDAGTSDELSCGFETSDMCGFFQTVTSFQWKRRSGSTPSSRTGPSKANEGQYYMYTEVSGPWSKGDNAVLESRTVFSAGTKCVQFDYNMFGKTIGTLDVMAGSTVLWSLSGNQGTKWLTQEIETSALGNKKLSFRGTYGGSWKGDIAIDNLSVTSGGCSSSSSSSSPCSSQPCRNEGVCIPRGISYKCTCTNSFSGINCQDAVEEPNRGPSSSSSTFDCNFESGLCGMVQGMNDDKNWRRTNTALTSGYFNTGYFIYISGSSGSPGDTAYIETGNYFSDTSSDRCVLLKVNMQGSSNGILSIGAKSTFGVHPITTVKYNTSGFWYIYYLTLSPSWLNSRKLYFQATTGSKSTDYIAIDDIKVTLGSCPSSRKRELEAKDQYEFRGKKPDKSSYIMRRLN